MSARGEEWLVFKGDTNDPHSDEFDGVLIYPDRASAIRAALGGDRIRPAVHLPADKPTADGPRGRGRPKKVEASE